MDIDRRDVPSALLQPVDWVKPSVNRDSAFERRLLFENFTIAGFKELELELEDQLRMAPSDTIRFQLATVLAQCMPTRPSLCRANELLASALKPDSDLSADLRKSARDVQRSVRSMLLESESAAAGRLSQVNWGIYNRCPLVCVGCYNIFNSQTLPLHQTKRVVEKLVAAGVEELVISGGDPLEWEDILPFVEHAHNCGLDVAIDTVGYSFTAETGEALGGKISYLGLPVDGSEQDVIAGFRKGKADLFQRVRHTLELCSAYGIPVKINTTVTNLNINDLDAVAQLLGEYDAVVAWSLFQWWDIRATPALRARMQVGTSRFRERARQLQQLYPQLGIWGQDVDRRARTHFFISANGEVYTFDSGVLATIIIGDISTDSMAELLESPALRKDSPKFRRSFPARPLEEVACSRA